MSENLNVSKQYLVMPYIRNYAITHLENDPHIRNGTLELGNFDCMEKMRPYVNEGDWVIAKLGKTFYETKYNGKKSRPFKERFSNSTKKQYLFYAMKVTSHYINNKNLLILCSKKGSYYCFFRDPIPIKRKFFRFLTNGQGNKKTEFEENDSDLANKFIKWIKGNKSETIPKSENNCPAKRCKKSCS